MKRGDKVKFLGCDKEQIRRGNNDDTREKLIIGNEYVVENVEVHSWLTKISLINIKGKFNSVCFDLYRGYADEKSNEKRKIL